jgi:hypothetical protein
VSSQPLLTGIRPYLNLATICERHILEADGTLTLFRVVDRFTITGATEEMPVTTLSFTLVVNFRSGHYRGPLDLSLQIIDPDQRSVQEIRLPVQFEAPEEKATQMIGQVVLAVKQHGLHWIIVRLAQEEYTRIPVRVVYQKLPTIEMGH